MYKCSYLCHVIESDCCKKKLLLNISDLHYSKEIQLQDENLRPWTLWQNEGVWQKRWMWVQLIGFMKAVQHSVKQLSELWLSASVSIFSVIL